MTGRELLKEQQRKRVEAMRKRKAQEKAKKKTDTKRVTGGKAPKTGKKATSVIEPLVKKVEKRSGSSLAISAGQKAGRDLRGGRTPDTDTKTKQEPKRRKSQPARSKTPSRQPASEAATLTPKQLADRLQSSSKEAMTPKQGAYKTFKGVRYIYKGNKWHPLKPGKMDTLG